jgi:thioredoxin-related protein
MQNRILFYLSMAILLLSFSYRHFVPTEEVQWMSLSQAESAIQKEKKPILVDLYTDWCGWCKVMDKKTYANKNVAKYVHDKFYPVKINAESRDVINFNGRTYQFNSQYKANDFAIYLTQGRLEFPTTIILPADGSSPQAIPGFLEPKDFELIAKYFGEGEYGKTPFEKYRQNFKASW